MWLGKNANKTDTLFGVQWPISALGISFSYNLKLFEQENVLQKVSKIQKLFNIWSQRDLSLYGKFSFEVLSWWKNNSGENLLFDDLSVMYGYNPEDPKTHILNYFILLGKRHIFPAKGRI